MPVSEQLGWLFVSRRTIVDIAVVAVVLVGWRLAALRLVEAEPQPTPTARKKCLNRIQVWEGREAAGVLHNRHRPPSC